jgi:hypothetical protein
LIQLGFAVLETFLSFGEPLLSLIQPLCERRRLGRDLGNLPLTLGELCGQFAELLLALGDGCRATFGLRRLLSERGLLIGYCFVLLGESNGLNLLFRKCLLTQIRKRLFALAEIAIELIERRLSSGQLSRCLREVSLSLSRATTFGVQFLLNLGELFSQLRFNAIQPGAMLDNKFASTLPLPLDSLEKARRRGSGS